MESIAQLKRNSEECVSYELCLLCQMSKNDKLFDASEQGLRKIKESSAERHKLRDFKYREAIERISSLSSSQEVVWHKSCYADFTHKGKIDRLKGSDSEHQRPSSRRATKEQNTSISLRSSTKSMEWENCMFCQVVDAKQKLSAVTTYNVSREILELAKYEHLLRVRLANVSDLIAAEGKYHAKCYKQFLRTTAKTKDETQNSELSIIWLSKELIVCAEHGKVIELSEVWNRFCQIAQETGTQIPPSFISRLSTFKEKLQKHIDHVYDFMVLADQTPAERKTILVPIKYAHVPMTSMQTSNQDDEISFIPDFKPHEDGFLSMVHVALKLRSEIQSHQAHKGLSVGEDDAIACVPENLYMFIRLIFGGQELFESGALEEDDDDDAQDGGAETGEEREAQIQARVLSVCQDLVYITSGGKKWTPKHIGLASTLHQATRSKQLVQLFHKAGHTISYRDVLRMDTALAKDTLKTMDETNGSVVPPNLVPGKFVHFTADNIDINDSSLDGKNTFHATQYAAWQRGPPASLLLENIEPQKNTKLEVPKVMETLIPANIINNKTEPQFENDVKKEWFNTTVSECPAALKAKATDRTFILTREHQDPKPTWTGFNEQASDVDAETTTVGYMPIIQSPAHEMDTMNTVVQRIIHVATSLQQTYIVLTVDQALFPQLMELKWTVPEYKDILIPRLGGLHTTMNFLKVLGQHMEDTGLFEVFTESGILGPNTTEHAMSGKDYSKGVRAHKLCFQALWRVLLPKLNAYLELHDNDLKKYLLEISQSPDKDEMDELVSILCSTRFQSLMTAFVDSNDDPNFQFWWQYMEMVGILLLFVRAQRDGLWELHVYSFRRMLPYFYRYDHTNYARWGSIYLAQMNQLPPEVETEFQQGNFVVKRSNHRFCQVDPDHSQEWLNSTGKKGGGIVGITKTTSALCRWALSYNLRAQIASRTYDMYGLGFDDQVTRNESTMARRRRDTSDEDKILDVLLKFKVFSDTTSVGLLRNIATKDLATDEIQNSLLHAERLGQEQLNHFVENRLMNHPDAPTEMKFHDPLAKMKAPTFASLYIAHKDVKAKEKTIKADRSILQRLITAYESGRRVNLHQVLQHELMPVPISLAETNHSLRSGDKSVLADVLTSGIICPAEIAVEGNSSLIIDGQALVVALGKPQGAVTFGDLADTFVKSVLQSAAHFQRVDVTFDRYDSTSIKDQTRQKRSKETRPIRRVIEDRSVPLPANWSNFLALPENKSDLANFLSHELARSAPHNKTVIVAGGLHKDDEVLSSRPSIDVTPLQAHHEEADTRIVLHCVNNDAETIVVSARDTDILVLLIAHYHQMSCTQLWMKAGTAKKRKYIPVHTICENLPFGEDGLESMVAFHSLTGCDSVSYIAGHSKKTSWKVFLTDHHLLLDLGRDPLTDSTIRKTEKFMCKIYGQPDLDTCDEVRAKLFCKCKTPETLPPTSDSLKFHIKRAHYQALVWRRASSKDPELPSPDGRGWSLQGGKLVPQLTSLPSVPDSCAELVSCGCVKNCGTQRCSCRKSNLLCTGACKCSNSDLCRNH